MTLGAPLLMNYSIELTHILDQISYQQGSLGELYPPDLSITAQLTEYWQFKSKVPALNTYLNSFLLSWKIIIHGFIY